MKTKQNKIQIRTVFILTQVKIKRILGLTGMIQNTISYVNHRFKTTAQEKKSNFFRSTDLEISRVKT